ncbi:MAG: hypothetical protein SVK08_00505 [Halobacteriota archaeon]|nr:hypothetical protein [Halobacteriota archaeon]
MSKRKPLIGIVRSFLVAAGYDGLYSTVYECSCLVDDLMPCGEPAPGCMPGYKYEGCLCGDGCDFHVVHDPEGLQDRVEELENEARTHAQAAQTATTNMNQIYKILSEGRCEPGSITNLAKQVVEELKEARKIVAGLVGLKEVLEVAGEKVPMDEFFEEAKKLVEKDNG